MPTLTTTIIQVFCQNTDVSFALTSLKYTVNGAAQTLTSANQTPVGAVTEGKGGAFRAAVSILIRGCQSAKPATHTAPRSINRQAAASAVSETDHVSDEGGEEGETHLGEEDGEDGQADPVDDAGKLECVVDWRSKNKKYNNFIVPDFRSLIFVLDSIATLINTKTL